MLTDIGSALAQSDASSKPRTAAHGEGRTPAFYRVRAASRAPGLLIAREPLEPALVLDGALSGERILYSSTDGVAGSKLVTVSGSVFLPRGKPPTGGWPLLAWAHGSVGIADLCAPSIQGRSLRDTNYLNEWLSRGYAIVATDYQGLGMPGAHPYMNARAAAYSILDSIRAAQRLGRHIGSKVAVIGQSQGAHAAVATAFYAQHYAPEIDIRGVVATGTPFYPQDQGVDGFLAQSKPEMEYLMYLLVAAQQIDSSIDDASIVTPQAQPLFRQTSDVCISRFEFDITASGLKTAAALRPDAVRGALASIIPTMHYPDLRARAPIFLGIGGKDAAVPAESQLALASRACAEGSVVEVHLYPQLSHGGAVSGSLPDSVPFLERAMRGEKIEPVCTPARSIK